MSFKMNTSLPSKSFPYHLCPHEGKRELLFGYGTVGQLDATATGSAADVLCQSIRGGNCGKLAAVHPVLPLSEVPSGTYPWTDSVMATTVALNNTAKSFCSSLSRIRKLPPKRVKQLQKIKESLTEPVFESVADADWFHSLLTSFQDTKAASNIQTVNSAYAGGALGYLPSHADDKIGFLLSPTGPSLSCLTLQSMCMEGRGVLKSKVVTEVTKHGRIYQVACKEVQSQGLCVVRRRKRCSLHWLRPDEPTTQLSPLGHTGSGIQNPTSVALSGYIPGECLVTAQNGAVHLWSPTSLKEVVSAHSPRFSKTSSWRHAHFGSHPRQVVYADPTALEMFDLRMQGASCCTELFSLPSKFLHKKERLRLADPHPSSPFYHTLATDYSLLLLDERFPKYPVLHWHHLLTSPPQYSASLDVYGTSPEDHAVFLGSQLPAELHCHGFSVKGGNPPQLHRDPWRAAKISDLSVWPSFTRDSDPYLLKERFKTSLMGIEVVPAKSGFAVLQMDALGEIFYQVYQETDNKQDLTFSAGIGSVNLKPDPVAMEICQAWIEKLVTATSDQCGKQENEKDVVTDATKKFQETFRQGCAHSYCSLCTEQLREETEEQTTDTGESCPSCGHTVELSRALRTSVEQGTLVRVESGEESLLARQLPGEDYLSQKSALSCLLIKDWQKDGNLLDILIERDKEIEESKKLKKAANKEPALDMSEASVLQRLIAQDMNKGAETMGQPQPSTSVLADHTSTAHSSAVMGQSQPSTSVLAENTSTARSSVVMGQSQPSTSVLAEHTSTAGSSVVTDSDEDDRDKTVVEVFSSSDSGSEEDSDDGGDQLSASQFSVSDSQSNRQLQSCTEIDTEFDDDMSMFSMFSVDKTPKTSRNEESRSLDVSVGSVSSLPVGKSQSLVRVRSPVAGTLGIPSQSVTTEADSEFDDDMSVFSMFSVDKTPKKSRNERLDVSEGSVTCSSVPVGKCQSPVRGRTPVPGTLGVNSQTVSTEADSEFDDDLSVFSMFSVDKTPKTSRNEESRRLDISVGSVTCSGLPVGKSQSPVGGRTSVPTLGVGSQSVTTGSDTDSSPNSEIDVGPVSVRASAVEEGLVASRTISLKDTPLPSPRAGNSGKRKRHLSMSSTGSGHSVTSIFSVMSSRDAGRLSVTRLHSPRKRTKHGNSGEPDSDSASLFSVDEGSQGDAGRQPRVSESQSHWVDSEKGNEEGTHLDDDEHFFSQGQSSLFSSQPILTPKSPWKKTSSHSRQSPRKGTPKKTITRHDGFL